MIVQCTAQNTVQSVKVFKVEQSSEFIYKIKKSKCILVTCSYNFSQKKII